MIFLFSTNIIINTYTKTPIVRLILLLTLLDEFLWTILYVCSSIIIIKWLKNKEIKSFFAGHIKIAVTKFTRLLLNMQIAMTTGWVLKQSKDLPGLIISNYVVLTVSVVVVVTVCFKMGRKCAIGWNKINVYYFQFCLHSSGPSKKSLGSKTFW